MEKQGKKLAKWLNKLQQESWQLELVVSGFAIFLLIGALDALDSLHFLQKINSAGLRQQGAALSFGYVVLTMSCIIILINLILHLLLRGMWISTIGLRYVSGDVDLEPLKLSPRFENFLLKRIGSFDQYIFNLENLCSVVFAFTFLIVFMLIGFAMFFLLIVFLMFFIENHLPEICGKETAKIIAISTLLTLFISGLLYFIDFVTLGWLKKIKWLSKVYFPIYRFFGFVTLARLYRPMYYNLVDNKFGRRVGFLMVPYVIAVMTILSFKIRSHIYFPESLGKSALLKDHYDDLRSEDRLVGRGSISSKYIENGYLELFIKYSPGGCDDALEMVCPDFRPLKKAGYGSDIQFGGPDSIDIRPDAPDTALVCLSQLFEIKVGDSIFQKPEFFFYQHKNEEERGLLTILDVNYLPRGKSKVEVNRLEKDEVDDRDTLIWDNYFTIPFWVE